MVVLGVVLAAVMNVTLMYLLLRGNDLYDEIKAIDDEIKAMKDEWQNKEGEGE